MIIRAYKFQLRVDDRQADQLSRSAGCCRLVWNMTLSMQKDRLDRGERVLRYGPMTSALPSWKQELPFLKEVPSQPFNNQ